MQLSKSGMLFLGIASTKPILRKKKSQKSNDNAINNDSSRIERMYNQGKSKRLMCAETGLTMHYVKQSIEQLLKKGKIKSRLHKERKNKYSDDVKIEAIKLRNRGFEISDVVEKIHKAFGVRVSIASVSQWANSNNLRGSLNE